MRNPRALLVNGLGFSVLSLLTNGLYAERNPNPATDLSAVAYPIGLATATVGPVANLSRAEARAFPIGLACCDARQLGSASAVAFALGEALSTARRL